MRPPYSQPAYTAHSRISADSGGSFMAKAIGNRMATPLIGPRPGSSPTTVPMKQPISAIIRFSGVPATAKPCISIDKVSSDLPAGCR